MPYSADTFVADEQPTTAKWNKLWANDASFNDGSGIADAAITPAKRSGGFYAGSFTNTGTGNRSITGVGFQPKMVMFSTLIGASASAQTNATGWMTAASQYAQWGSANAAGNQSVRNSYTNLCLAIGAASSNVANETAAYVSMDSDGFTINVTANSNNTWAYMAFG